ncbi:TPM domain-containing protein [Chelatococcus sp. SYSU_G07232]|uniref:TPM domain-containing protein n=1 Tax=Chelatococcus albus TaxID=3047466 RepID=A0ABT7AK39_9HYPH|nr:TPM domain-containing protein [Chelatococcus sp. SYSU_G07232]MDJ1159747.1 TPM domain-containing protein [Chelatococcus sp. SYSU_G07232]
MPMRIAGPVIPRSAAFERLFAALRLFAAFAFLAAAAVPALPADPAFPPLTGRVVDAASLLADEARARIAAKLEAHEGKTSDQIVVATVPGLGDLSVEEYANRLFRRWALGAKDKNNGVLLLVAPRERKVRIEVGYGLEGALTDALSKVIITTAIAPRFKQGDFAGGIEAGVDAIAAILTGDAEEWQRRATVRTEESGGLADILVLAALIFVLAIIVVVMLRTTWSGRRAVRYHRTRGGHWIALPGPTDRGGSSGGWLGGGWSAGSSGGGGFSGGGGSSGGGGASGDW